MHTGLLIRQTSDIADQSGYQAAKRKPMPTNMSAIADSAIAKKAINRWLLIRNYFRYRPGAGFMITNGLPAAGSN